VRSLLLALACSSLGQTALPTVQQIDALVKETMSQWGVPGLAVAIVHQDRLVYLKGFGVKNVNDKAPVTADTIFPLGSCSKSFTTLGLAMLVDEKRLHWDDPVRKHLPWFKLADPLADANVTVRDLITHRTGLGRHEWLWYRSPENLEARVRKLAFLQPSHSFRSAFEYQTIAVGAAGLVLERAAGTPWQDFMQERIFKPLEMPATSAVFLKERAAVAAMPHRMNSVPVVIERYPQEEPDPAGSVHSTARDLAKYLRLQLDQGLLDQGALQGKRLVSAPVFAELHRPHMLIRRENFAAVLNPDTHVLCYGLGWVLQDYRGQWLIMHGGAIDGFRAHLTLVPEAGLGIALLNNLDRTMMNVALSNNLVDRFCGLPDKDWNGYFKLVQEHDERSERNHVAQMLSKRRAGTKPSLALPAYTGEYVDPAYGTCEVKLEDGKLMWRWSSFRGPLEHFHFDTFVTRAGPTEYVSVVFQLNSVGEVESLKMLERTFVKRP
jgi:CubicO group peptidase (beta-lactamase class C family)